MRDLRPDRLDQAAGPRRRTGHLRQLLLDAQHRLQRVRQAPRVQFRRQRPLGPPVVLTAGHCLLRPLRAGPPAASGPLARGPVRDPCPRLSPAGSPLPAAGWRPLLRAIQPQLYPAQRPSRAGTLAPAGQARQTTALGRVLRVPPRERGQLSDLRLKLCDQRPQLSKPRIPLRRSSAGRRSLCGAPAASPGTVGVSAGTRRRPCYAPLVISQTRHVISAQTRELAAQPLMRKKQQHLSGYK